MTTGRPMGKSLIKTMLEKKKILETRIFLFSYKGVYPIEDKFNVLSNINLQPPNAFIWRTVYLLTQAQILDLSIIKPFL